MLTLAVLIVLYFLPSILARNKPSFLPILLLNFFLGWTILGWFGALIWGLAEAPRPQVVVIPAPAAASAGRFCCSCGAPTPGRFCGHCGKAYG